MINRPLYVDKIMAYTDTPFVKVLTGVRRCGKSTVLKMIMEKLQQEHGIPSERIVSMRFDSMDYEDMTAKDMFKAVKEKLNLTGRTYLFLDEVQEIEGWEKVVNSLATDYDVDLYVTGSNSRMMSSEIATYLTGRYVSFRHGKRRLLRKHDRGADPDRTAAAQLYDEAAGKGLFPRGSAQCGVGL